MGLELANRGIPFLVDSVDFDLCNLRNLWIDFA